MESIKRSFVACAILFAVSLLFIVTSCRKEEAPIVPKNHKPIIESLTATPDTLLINTSAQLTCIVSDKDNDKLTITWLSKRGNFTAGNFGSEVKWKAPSTAGKDTLVVTVSDGKESVTRKLEIIIGAKPSIPILSMPANGVIEVDLSTYLIWQTVKNAESYNLQLSTDHSFAIYFLNRTALKGTKLKVSGLKIGADYYWRVRSKNIFGISEWSKIFSFSTVAPPQTPLLILPNDSARDVSLKPTINWKQVKNADSYAIQVSTSETFSSLVFDKYCLADTSLEISGLNYFMTYYWRVNASNSYGTSAWSEFRKFSTIGTAPPTPNLSMSHNGAARIARSVNLIWNESSYAESYNLQVSDDSSFINILFDKSGLTEMNSLIQGLSNTKKYYWRISAANSYGISNWSDTWSFTTLLSKPVLSLPENSTSDISPSPTISWNPIEEADSYSLQISTDSSFSDIVYDKNGITSTQYQVSGLATFTKYYWRVSAENKFDKSEWSATRAFNVSGYFYKGLTYGNQALYNPVYAFLSGGFDMIQVGNRRNIKDFPYRIAAKNIWKNLSDPFTSIKHYGWWNFMKDQVLPLTLNKKNAQFWPNYTLHLIGGGMEYAALKEWFEYYDYPIPGWLSAFTVMSYHLVNEVAENNNYQGDDVDPIADIYLFDIGGILLFTSESVKRFFSEDLNLADWSQQPSFSLRNGELHNNGQFFSVKWKFPFSDSWHAFYYFGTNGVGGLSYKYEDGSAISVGFGLAASDLILLDEKTNKKTLGLVGNIGLFYDRNNSLLASLSVTIKTDYMVNVNVYPGVINIGDISPGLWGAYSQDGNVILGLAVSWFPVGFANSIK